jgi:hypothetical protein
VIKKNIEAGLLFTTKGTELTGRCDIKLFLEAVSDNFNDWIKVAHFVIEATLSRKTTTKQKIRCNLRLIPRLINYKTI